jgi:REP element-mobilizing transposase RayT
MYGSDNSLCNSCSGRQQCPFQKILGIKHALPPRKNAGGDLFFYGGDVPDNLQLLRTAFRLVKDRHPFTIDAFVLLPEHLHCIWTLPLGDKDYSMRWNAIKGHFTRHCAGNCKPAASASQQRKRAQAVWQPRFWEHQIRDEWDYEKHCD